MYRPALNEEESKAKIEKLQNELKDLRDHVHVKDEKYFSEITSMESENLSLKKKLKSVEIKYTTLSFTPPKVSRCYSFILFRNFRFKFLPFPLMYTNKNLM